MSKAAFPRFSTELYLMEVRTVIASLRRFQLVSTASEETVIVVTEILKSRDARIKNKLLKDGNVQNLHNSSL